ncbi:MAG: beta-lactamase [Chitinophagaceae bacterium]|nr:beta-lactamase [Chitinophagaceae bacterium]
MVQSATTTIVIDTTPDFRYQMLRVHNNRLDAVLFTHPHKDHIAGLDDIRPFNYFQGKPIKVYANELTKKTLLNDFYYAFADHKYPGVPDIQLLDINNKEDFIIGDIPVIPILVWHHKMPVLGFRFKDFTYITDANRIDEAEKEKIKGSSVLVLNALRHEEHIAHFTLDEAVELIEELKVPNAYLTHISHQLGKHKDVEHKLPPHIRLAYDGMQISAPA